MPERLCEGSRGYRKKLTEVARAWALGQIESEAEQQQDESEVDSAAAAIGLAPAWPATTTEPLYLWPENVRSWQLFIAVNTQWNVGPTGAVGLNYLGVEVVMRRGWRIKRRDEQRLFNDIQIMERATLRAWQEKDNG